MAWAFYSGAMILLLRASSGLSFHLAGIVDREPPTTPPDAGSTIAGALFSLLFGGHLALDLATIPVALAMLFFAFKLVPLLPRTSGTTDDSTEAVEAGLLFGSIRLLDVIPERGTLPVPLADSGHILNLRREDPDWNKCICSLKARVSTAEQEQVLLIADVLSSKLHSLGFDAECCTAYRSAVHELAANALEHGTDSRHTAVTIRADICKVYAVITVEHPKHTEGDLSQWLETARSRLDASTFSSRGRGLLLVSRLVDNLSQTRSGAIKALVCADRVRIVTEEQAGIPIVRTVSGHSNPSYGVRVRNFLETTNADRLVLAIDVLEERRLLDSIDLTMRIFLLLPLFAQHENWRIVCSSDILRGLLPKESVHKSVEDAIASFGLRER